MHAIELFMKHVLPKFLPPQRPWVDSSVKYCDIFDISITRRVYIDKGVLPPFNDNSLLSLLF